MAKKILIDVDTQFDFMDPEGALYVEADQSVRDAIKNTLMQASANGTGESYDAVIGSVDSHAYDAWEFAENGGPFPPHCVKGQAGWLRMNQHFPAKQRFIPMTTVARDPRNRRILNDPYVLVGEATKGGGSRRMDERALAKEAVEGKVGLYFEKEVYSLFDNQMAEPVLQQIGCLLGGNWNEIQIDVIGYAAGGYCIDAAVTALCKTISIQRASIRVLSYATAAIGGVDGMAKSKQALTALGAEWVESP